jgi:hypothetical protein
MQSNNPFSGPISLGPIIGKVTDSTARILVEFKQQGQYTCVLTPAKGGNSVQVTGNFLASRAGVFKFANLAPSTKYNVTFNPQMTQVPSSFTTISDKNDGRLRVAVISCNESSVALSKQGKKEDLWTNVYKQYQDDEIDYLLQIGDSVYMDWGGNISEKPWQKTEVLLKGVTADKYNNYAGQVIELIKGEYRKTWQIPSIATTLANVPNITMGDDHEVKDDWGFKQDDWTPKTLSHFYGSMARCVYYEFQRQLREDVNLNDFSSIKEEYHHHVINGVGIYFLDYRGIRTWHRDEKDLGKSQIGKRQTDHLKQLLSKTGDFGNLNNVIIVSTVPIVIFPKTMTKAISAKIDDAMEQWTYSNTKEQGQLLNIFKTWKDAKKGREMVLVGGDIHYGGMTEVRKGSVPVFKQLTASAMNNKEGFSKVAMDVLNFLQSKLHDLDNGWRMYHQDFIKENNYGLINFIPSKDGFNAAIKLVAVQDGELRTIEWQNPSSGCCNIF